MRNTSGIFFSIICALALAVMTVACSNGERHFDASGTFEAEEVIVSALATGTIMDFDIQEGDLLRAGQMVGYIDSTQLFLKKRQLESQIRSTLVQKPDIRSQIASLQVQLASAEREQRRVENLLAAGAASQKQLDDSNSQVEIIRKQLLAQQSALGITTASITE
jgi:HlyD family secretion protein